MKKTTYLKSLLLIIAIAFSSANVFSAADTYTYVSGDGSGDGDLRTYQTTSFDLIHKKNTSSNAIVSNYSELRVYASHSFEIAPKQAGKVITSIVFTTTSGSYATKLNEAAVLAGVSEASATALTGKSSVSGNNVTFDLTSVSNVAFFKVTLAAQTRFSSIVINYTESSSCTASNLAFAEAIVNKIVGDGMFTQLATGLNATTAITYESDNAAVASVNETTGEVTVVAAGTAKITATQVAGTHSAVDYCAATAEYTINVITTAPTITVTEVLPTMTTNLATAAQQTLTVGAANLTADITMTISGTDAALFGVTSTLPATGGVITVAYTPTTVGTHSATLQINSPGATEVLVALNGSAIDLNGAGTQMNPYTVMDVKTLNNSLGTTNKYWVEGYIVGVPSGGNGTDLTTVDLIAPFTSNTVLALAPTANETDLTNMIAVQLPSGAVRDALNLVANPTLLTRKVKVYGTLEGYFSGTPGVKNTSDYELVAPNSDVSATVQSLRRVGNQLVFDATAQQTVTVFNAVGQRLMSTTTIEGTNAITVNAKGLVFVRIDKQTVKVVF